VLHMRSAVVDLCVASRSVTAGCAAMLSVQQKRAKSTNPSSESRARMMIC
jgi:hypothetical protein